MRNNKTMKIIYKTFLISIWCSCLSLSVSTQLSTVNPFTTTMKWWNNIVDEFEMVLNIDGNEICISSAWTSEHMKPFVERMKSKGVRTE